MDTDALDYSIKEEREEESKDVHLVAIMTFAVVGMPLVGFLFALQFIL